MNIKEIKAKARKIAGRMKAVCGIFNLSRFWTFTFFCKLSEKERMKKWNLFIHEMRYWYPSLQYVGCKELHPGEGKNGGRIHIHVLFNVYVDWEIAQGVWEQIGAGQVIWVKWKTPWQIYHYVVKYVTKSLEDGLKQVVIQSREFCLHSSSIAKWLLKTVKWGHTEFLKWALDNFDFGMYDKICGRKKRKEMREVWNIGVLLGV